MGAVDTTYTFTATDAITSAKMNNIIDQTTITADAIIGTTLDVASGKLKIRSAGITSNEMGAGSVTPAATTFADALLPSGAVMPFARNSAPSGWLAADGASVSTATYAALFDAIGYTYGGSGGSFNLPDLRGIFVRGGGSQTISGITYTGTFATKQQDLLKSHNHTGATSTNGDHSHVYSAPAFVSEPGGGSGPVQSDNRSFFDTSVNGAHNHSFTTDSTGGTETRPANIALLYCIKL